MYIYIFILVTPAILIFELKWILAGDSWFSWSSEGYTSSEPGRV